MPTLSDAGDPAAFVDAEKIKRAEAEIMVLQRQLESKETEAVMVRGGLRMRAPKFGRWPPPPLR